VAFSPDGKLLASGDSNGTVRLWNPVTGERVGTVRLWNPATGQPVGADAPPAGQAWGWRTAPPGGGCRP
jgi:WD40 repeat protein